MNNSAPTKNPLKIQIAYCGEWNYLPQATSLAAAIEKEFGAKANLKKGHGGVFEVTVNGKLVFDKREKGRFPETVEVLEEIRKLGRSSV